MKRQLLAIALLAGTLPALAGAGAPAVPAAIVAPSRTVTSDFEIVVKRSLFRTKRQVDVAVTLDGLDASVWVRFNKPVKQALGIKHVAFQLHVLDEAGDEVEMVTVEIPEGTTDLEFPLAFPRDGSYVLALDSEDIIIAPARARLIPGGEHRIELEVGAPIPSFARASSTPTPTGAH